MGTYKKGKLKDVVGLKVVNFKKKIYSHLTTYVVGYFYLKEEGRKGLG